MNKKLEIEDSKPPSGLIERIKKFFKNPFFIKTTSVSEVSDFLKDAVDLNIIDKEVEDIANNAIQLGKTTVKDIMVPRVDMTTVSSQDKTAEIIETIIESGHSRYPVLGKDRDEVLGILLAKDILPILANKKDEFDIKSMLRDAKVVPETKKADSLLQEFKENRSHLAVVIDEYGVISGLITIEDILEELVGEIEDEHDQSDVEIIELSNNKYSADAKVELDVFNEYFELNLDVLAIDAETIGGFVIDKLGILPKVGDSLKINNLTLKVVDADPRKLKKLLIIKNN